MIEELKKYLTNRSVKKALPCEKYIGSNTNTIAFSNFWAEQGESLEVLAAAKLHEFTTDNEFTKEELIAYKKGIADIASFFQQCWIERDLEMKKKDELLNVPDAIGNI